MHIWGKRMGLGAVVCVLLGGLFLWGCGLQQEQAGDTVQVNLALVLDSQEARRESPPSMVLAFIERWVLGVGQAWAQVVADIASIEVTISAPDQALPRSSTVPVSDPSSGQLIPVSIQAPVGSDRTIAVSAFNAAGQKIYSGSTSGVDLQPGTPINVEIRLARTVGITVQKQGTGSGTVTSSPGGLECGSSCSAQFDAGTSVVLSAAAAPGSGFVGWSGAGCSGTGACRLHSNATVVAIFNAGVSTANLSVARSGTGTGTVGSNPSGIACGAGCSASFPVGSSVTLLATAMGGSTFAGWSGACSGTGPCVVVMNGNQAVTAQFEAAPTVLLTVTKTGNGTVNSTPAGINCGPTCSAGFISGNSVTLTATATGGSTFGGWGEACTGTGACTIVMNGNQTVSATFNAPPTDTTLTVVKSGTGAGTVSSAPAGINGCSATCTANFPPETPVTLTATPTGGSTFTGWGGACSGTGACSVSMTNSQSVTAEFAASPSTAALTVTMAGAGTGTISSTPAGINGCAATCTANFSQGTSVTLTATATGGSTFAGWSDGCTGTGSCVVAMNGNQTRTAMFNPPQSMATLTVSKTGTGSGTVTSSPPGIDCGPTCSAGFLSGSSVTLSVAAASGSTFVGWTGGGCSGTGACVTVMSASQTVVAQFTTTPNVDALTVIKNGLGSGTVTSAPSGINCGTVCTFNFTSGTSVTLTATPAIGSTFGGWSGGGCGGAGSCVVNVSGDQTVTATFNVGIP